MKSVGPLPLLSRLTEMPLVFLGVGLNALSNLINNLLWLIYHILVCVRNANKLLLLLVHGTRTWVFMLGRLLLFSFMLMPGWYHLLKYWFLHPLILRNVEYGKGAKFRNMLDIYLPFPLDIKEQWKHNLKVFKDGAPVVVFVSGGAWMIGYKLWSALVGRGLASLGILTIVPDYRNFPQGNIHDMMTDVRLAVEWAEANAQRFGGNPKKIVLAGQSAGAHICMCAIVEEYLNSKQSELSKNKDTHEFTRSHGCEEDVGGQGSEEDPFDVLDPVRNLSSHSLFGTECNNNEDISEIYDASNISIDDLKNIPTCHLPRAAYTSELGDWTTDSDDGNSTTSDRLSAVPNKSAEDFSVISPIVSATRRTPLRLTPSPDQKRRLSSGPLHSNQLDILSKINLFIGVSGPYNLHALRSHLHSRGLDSSILHWICEGNLCKYSPTVRLRNFIKEALSIKSVPLNTSTALAPAVDKQEGLFQSLWSALFDDSKVVQQEDDTVELPHTDLASNHESRGLFSDMVPIALFHGSKDKTIPVSISDELARLLKDCGANVEYKSYEGWSHTDAILEAPLSGNTRLFRDILRVVYKYTEEPSTSGIRRRANTDELQDGVTIPSKQPTTAGQAKDVKQFAENPMAPKMIVRLARSFNPF